MNEFDELVDIVKKLREECPWDMEQTHESLSRHLIEEAYELLDSLASIEEKDSNYELVKDDSLEIAYVNLVIFREFISKFNYDEAGIWLRKLYRDI